MSSAEAARVESAQQQQALLLPVSVPQSQCNCSHIIHHNHPANPHQPTTAAPTAQFRVNVDKAKILLVSAIHIINGMVTFLLQILLWIYIIDYCPFCSGIIYIPTGLVGLVAYKKSNRCTFIALMVLSIMSCVFAVPGFAVALVNGEEYYKSESGVIGWMIVPVVMAMGHLLEFIVALVTAAVCCKLVCCSPDNAAAAQLQITVIYMTAPGKPPTVADQLPAYSEVDQLQQSPPPAYTQAAD